jgi:hypothetical protein
MAVKEPGRFAQLALKFPQEASPVYYEEVIRAIQNTSIDDILKLQVASKAFLEQRDACGGGADLLGTIEDPLPQEFLEQLGWLALFSSDPSDEVWKKESGHGKKYFDGDPYFHGINTTRGRAALAIGTLINRDPKYVARFEDTLQKMAEEQSEAVLTCIAFTFRAIAVRDYEYAWELFERCCIRLPGLQG